MLASSHTRHAEDRTVSIATDRRRRGTSGGAVALLAAALLLALPMAAWAQTRVLVTSTTAATVNEGADTSSLPACTAAAPTTATAACTYTVRLSTKPTGDVTVTVTSSNTAATVSPASLTFMPINWSTAQSVTVTAKDDEVDNAGGGRFVTITHTPKGGDVSQKASLLVVVRDDEEGDDAADVVILTYNEDDPPSLIPLTSREVTVTERGRITTPDTIENTNTHYVRLNTKPTGTVTVAVTSSNTSVATVSPGSLTFTPQNWKTGKPVTVTGVDDRVANPDNVRKAIVTHTPTGGGYDDVSPVEMSITVRDIGDESSGETPDLLLVPPTLTVDEGDSATYRVSLGTQPTGNVTVRIGSESNAVTWSPETSLTFTPGNYSTPQTVTVTGKDNDVDAADGSATLNHTSSGSGYDAVTGTLSVTVTDDDERGLIVTGLPEIMSEAATERFKVRLATEPTEDVTVTVTATPSTGPAGSGTVTVDTNRFLDDNQSTLTFTSGNWSDEKEVVINATDDDIVNPGRSVTIEYTLTGGDYGSPFEADDSVVRLTDNEVPSLRVTPANIEVQEESDTPKSFTVALGEGGKPSSDVTVSMSAVPSDIVALAPTTVTLSATAMTESVDVSVASNEGAYPDRNVVITLRATGGGYDDVGEKVVTVKVKDNDVATWLRSSSTAITEGKDPRPYTVRLSPSPSVQDGDVTVTVEDSDFLTVVPSSLTINAGSPSGVLSISASDDGVDTGDRVTYFRLSRSGDSVHEVVKVTVRDIHTRGLKFTKESGDSLPSTIKVDSGGTENYRVELMSAPAASGTVTVTVVSSDPAAATATPATLTFTATAPPDPCPTTTPRSWGCPYTVTVTGRDIGKPVGSKTVKLIHTAEGADYENLKPKEQSVRVTATAEASSAGIVLSSSAETVEEGGDPKQYTVRLKGRPAIGENERVIVAVDSSNTGVVTVSPKSLTFTLANWDKPQTVTWRAVPDRRRGERTATIRHTPRGGGYTSRQAASLTVTVRDNTRPGLLVDPQVSVAEGSTTSYTVVLNTIPTGNVKVALRSENPSVATVTPESLTFTSSDTSRTVTVTGVDDNVVNAGGSRSATITHEASGSDYDNVTATATVTVTDDDATVTVSPTSVTVAEAGGRATYTVKLNGQPTENVTVAVTSSSTTAATVSTASLVFTPSNWSTAQTVTVTGVDDEAPAGNRSATITHEARGGGYDEVEVPSVSVSVTDDDGMVVSKEAVTVAESGGTDTYTVRLKTPPSSTVTVNVSSSNTSIATVSPSTLTFTPGNSGTAQTVTVTGVNDDLYNEGSRPATITNAPSGAGYDSNNSRTVAVTVTDDEAAPTGIALSVAPSQVIENAGATRITVTATVNGTHYAAAKAITVTVGASGDSATERTDYQAVGTVTVRIPAGAASGTGTFTLTPINDAVFEGNETITVAGTLAGGVTVTPARITLADDDTPPELSISGGRVAEGAPDTTAVLEFIVTRSESTAAATVGYADAGTGTATAGEDYRAVTPGRLTLAAGESRGTIRVTVLGDDTYEGDETVVIELSETPTATIAAGKGSDAGIITDDDAKPTLSISGLRVAEGAPGAKAELEFVVTKSGATSKAATVDYADSGDGTATSGTDYEAVTGSTLTFAAAETVKTIAVTVIGDAVYEDDETVVIELSERENATIAAGMGSAEGTIANDDDPPLLSISGSSVAEGDEGEKTALIFTVTKSGPVSELPTMVGYADNGSGTADSGTDYEAVTAGTLTFAVGESEQTIAVTVLGDAVYEDDETVVIELRSPTDGEISTGAGEAAGTITNDDAAPVLWISGSSVAEGDTGQTTALNFTVTKSGATNKAATVEYEDTRKGTATSGTDYRAVTDGTLTFAAAETVKTIAVTVIGDAEYEENETVEIKLSNPKDATIAAGKGSAKGTITDDDPLPRVAKDWLARFGRTAAAATLDAIARRMNDGAAAVGESSSSLTVAGRQVRLGQAPAAGRSSSTVEPWEDAVARVLTLEDLADDSAFDLERSFVEGTLNVWGATAYNRFEMPPQDEYRMDGSLVSAILGFDHEGANHVAGLAAAYHGGTGTFSGIGTPPISGDLGTNLFSVHPYVRITFGNVHVGGSFGLGTGGLRIEQQGQSAIETGVGMSLLAAADARVDLSLAEAWVLAVQADGLVVHMVSEESRQLPAVEAAASRLRLGLENSFAFLIGDGVSLAPVLETALRYDDGDAETGFGLDVGGGLRIDASGIGLMVDARGSASLNNWGAKQEDRAPVLRDWGIGGVIHWRLDFDGHGPEVTLAPAYGAQAHLNAVPSLDAVVGYRLPAFGGVLTPYSSAELAGGGQRSYRVGARLELDRGVYLSAEGTRKQPPRGDAEQHFTVQLRLLQ